MRQNSSSTLKCYNVRLETGFRQSKTARNFEARVVQRHKIGTWVMYQSYTKSASSTSASSSFCMIVIAVVALVWVSIRVKYRLSCCPGSFFDHKCNSLCADDIRGEWPVTIDRTNTVKRMPTPKRCISPASVLQPMKSHALCWFGRSGWSSPK